MKSCPTINISLDKPENNDLFTYSFLGKATNVVPKVVSNFEIVSWLGNQGIENGHPMNHGGKWKFDFGTVKCVNAVHSSINLPI